MSNLPSKPFSSGTEYEVFKYNFCEDCIKHKLREDGFPAFPEDGGCPIEDAMENARFDISQFPSKNIRELRDSKDNSVITWHCCNEFDCIDNKWQEQYLNMMKRARSVKQNEQSI